jgi:hypothetical protein
MNNTNIILDCEILLLWPGTESSPSYYQIKLICIRRSFLISTDAIHLQESVLNIFWHFCKENLTELKKLYIS